MINKLLCVYFCVIIGLGVGYCINIYKLFKCDFDPISKEEVIRGISVFVPPAGGIVGYIDIDDKKENTEK